MIAALPMYDRPELTAETDRFWGLIREALRDLGQAAPETLTRDRDPWEIWQAADLVLAQTCGLPYRARLHDHVTLVATPDYGLPGCPPSHYNSVIISRESAQGPRAAINDPLSQSGWAALVEWARAEGHRFTVAEITGGHRASARAVAEGHADFAAIDAETWRLMLRYDAWTTDLTEVARTTPTPGLPFITAKGADPAPIRTALTQAIDTLSPADRDVLGLKGITVIDKAAYLALPLPPNVEANARF